MYTFDTNAIIYYVQDEVTATPILKEIISTESVIYISSITEVELFRFPHLAPTGKTAIEEILKTTRTIVLDSDLARFAGFLGKHYFLELADSVIAATALSTATTLVTRNIKDFKKIPHLKLLTI